MPPRFFITHSHHDNPFVSRLATDLKRAGLDGFLDIYSLKPGDLISLEISRGLEACDYYLPVLSHLALDSPWCELEIHTAITLSNEAGRHGRPRIIPLLVEDCRERLDPFLRSRLYIKFHYHYEPAFLSLLRAVGVGGVIGQIQPVPEQSGAGETLQFALNDSGTISQALQFGFLPDSAPAPSMPQPVVHSVNAAGQEMILIPTGESMMGSEVRAEEKPVRRVYLDAFCLSRYPVTNAEYQKFIDATHAAPPKFWHNGTMPMSKAREPVVGVSWDEARAFCKWVGGRLPTDAEWEKAAGWDDEHKHQRIYPWGNEFDPAKCNVFESYISNTTYVGKYSPAGDSPYGVGDMVGNVLEWCEDWYDPAYYARMAQSPNPFYKNPRGPATGTLRVLRGGSFLYAADYARCAFRSGLPPDKRYVLIGFRVAQSVD